MIIEIEAVDTLFFRDGKPFTMGEDVWANGMFPPNPSVIYGALRSKYFSEHPEELSKANGDNDPTKDLVIKGILLKKGSDFLLPYPLDCVKIKGKNNKPEILRLSVNERNNISNSNFKLMFTEVDEKVETLPDSFMDEISFLDYLTYKNKNLSEIQKSDLIISEPKIGIGINKQSGISEDGKLYRIGMVRPVEDISIVLEFDNLKIKSKGIIKLGGEAKAASYKTIDPLPDFTMSKFDENIFCLYLLTPAIFKNGWLPEGIDENSGKGTINGIDVELITAAIGKPTNIGGFDMKERKPKTMYKAVPAGSVYYFKSEVTNKDQIRQLNYESISDFNKKEGYGLALIGKVKRGNNQ